MLSRPLLVLSFAGYVYVYLSAPRNSSSLTFVTRRGDVIADCHATDSMLLVMYTFLHSFITIRTRLDYPLDITFICPCRNFTDYAVA